MEMLSKKGVSYGQNEYRQKYPRSARVRSAERENTKADREATALGKAHRDIYTKRRDALVGGEG